MMELKALKQNSNVKEYHNAFDVIIRSDLRPTQALKMFIAGLEPKIQYFVRSFNPQTIQQAYCLAKRQEATLKAIKQKYSKKLILPTPRNFQKRTPNTFQTQKPLTNTYQRNPGAPFNPNPSNRALTPVEFEEKRAKNHCFSCDEKFERGHRCKEKRPQLYHLEIEEVEDIEEEEEAEEAVENELAQIYVQALAGVSDYQTIRVTGHVGRRSVQMLLDTGSTHNFLDTVTTQKLGCNVTIKGNMSVRVADGRKLVCDTVVEGFTWKMQGLQFTADLFLMPLKGCDMVLGV